MRSGCRSSSSTTPTESIVEIRAHRLRVGKKVPGISGQHVFAGQYLAPFLYIVTDKTQVDQTHSSSGVDRLQHLQDYLAATDGAVEAFAVNEMTRLV